MGGRPIRIFRDIVRAIWFGAALGLVTGCAQAPDLPSSRFDSEERFAATPWPELIAYDDALGADAASLENPGPALLARAEILRRRAEELRAQIITPQDRARIDSAVARRRSVTSD